MSKDCPCGLGCDGACPKTEDEKRLAQVRADSKYADDDVDFLIKLLDEEKRARTEAEKDAATSARVLIREVDERKKAEAALAEERAKSVRAENRLARWVPEAAERAETAEARVAELEARIANALV